MTDRQTDGQTETLPIAKSRSNIAERATKPYNVRTYRRVAYTSVMNSYMAERFCVRAAYRVGMGHTLVLPSATAVHDYCISN